MAHFAEIDATNTVLRVLVVGDDDIADERFASGESEQRGKDFLEALLPGSGPWVQTSYNNNLRARYAAVGGTYDSAADEFIPASPFPSWSWDGNAWLPPTPYPDDGDDYNWEEATTSWVLVV
jgi:hypothetical protein